MTTFLAHFTLLVLIFNYSGLPQSFILLFLFVYSVCVFRFLVRDGFYWEIFYSNKLYVFLLILTIISQLRTNNGNLSTKTILISIYSFSVCLIFYSHFIIYSIRTGRNPFIPILNVVSFSSLVNTFVFVVYGNVRSSSPDVDSLFMSLLTGSSSSKMACIFGALSINHNSVLIAIVLPLIFFIKKKLLRTPFFLINIISLILIDCRAAFLAVLSAGLLFYPLIKMRNKYAVSILFSGLFLSPPFYTLIIPLAPQVLGLEFLSRNKEELYTANSRTIIWSEAIEDISTISGPTLIGSGEYGNLAFRSSEKYLPIFQNYRDSEVKTIHNTYLQVILDSGYLFFAILVFVSWREINKLINDRRNKIAIMLALSLFTFFVAGISEVLLGFYYMPITFVFFVIIFYSKNQSNCRIKNAL